VAVTTDVPPLYVEDTPADLHDIRCVTVVLDHVPRAERVDVPLVRRT
jgi:hypothetical protein